MLKTVDFYYFSPTGGTKKAGGVLASEIAEAVNEVNLAEKTVNKPSSAWSLLPILTPHGCGS